MTKWSEGNLTANQIRIHYYRTGGDKPKVVFCHGAGDDGLCWTHVVKELEEYYDVIMVDARGHGKSSSGKKDYSTRQRVADLVGLIQALKLERPVIGGHSMGADTCLNLAAECPQLIRGVFLEDPPIFSPNQPLFGGEQAKGQDIGKLMKRFMMMFKLMPKFIAVRMARKASPTYPDDEIIPWVDSKHRMSFDFLNSMSLLDFAVADPFAPFKKVEVPILLIIGDREKMSIVSEETAQEAARINPKVEVVHLQGASHDIRRTRFDGYMPALKRFLGMVYQEQGNPG
jgi:N-formylmaleamate deformylase